MVNNFRFHFFFGFSVSKSNRGQCVTFISIIIVIIIYVRPIEYRSSRTYHFYSHLITTHAFFAARSIFSAMCKTNTRPPILYEYDYTYICIIALYENEHRKVSII